MWDRIVKWFRGDQYEQMQDDGVAGKETDSPTTGVESIGLTDQKDAVKSYDSTVDTIPDTGLFYL